MTFEHFCETEPPYGPGIPLATLRRIREHKNDMDPLHAVLGPRGAPKGNQNAVKDEDKKKANKGSKTTFEIGRGVAYLRARLQRDHSDVLAQLERGEHRSVRQAAIAAGIVRVPSALENPKNAAKTVAVVKLGTHGGNRKKGYQVADGTLKTRGSTQASYLRARLKRDAPGILKQLERGAFPSVRQAAIAAGIVKVPSALEKVQKAVQRLSTRRRAGSD